MHGPMHKPCLKTATPIDWPSRPAPRAVSSLAAILATLIAAVSAAAHRLYASWSRARSARATYRALRELDTRTLHDLGLDRSEMRSVAAEIAGESDRTRVQALRTLRALSLF